ncbi:MAG: hypothetical protein NTY19_43420 [Planctomycetota bacterium]|nr:hypothetical protein [Planctomycetota bacterium]
MRIVSLEENCWLCVAGLLLAVVMASQLPAATLVRNGQARAVVVVPNTPDDHERRAAKDLVDYVAKMSGATLAEANLAEGQLAGFLADAKANGRAAVVFGRLALPQVRGLLGARAQVRGAFALRVTKHTVWAAGPVEGTYYAAIELLEQLGCRWFMPGEFGTVVPALKTVQEQETVQAPSFPSRWFQMPDRDWQMRVRCGGDDRRNVRHDRGLHRDARGPDADRFPGGPGGAGPLRRRRAEADGHAARPDVLKPTLP